MARQATRLSDFIKPAAPNDEVKARIAHNTDSWMKNNLKILYEHYETVIQSLRYDKHNKVSLDIAKGWAGRRYGACLKLSTLTIVESFFVSGEEGEGRLECGHSRVENEEGGEEIAAKAPEIDVNDEEQFPALPTKASGKLNFVPKNTLFLGKWKTLVEEAQDSKKRQGGMPAPRLSGVGGKKCMREG